MSEDHLDKNLTVSGSITDTGLEARSNSRAANSLDRLIGSIVDVGSSYFEGISDQLRARATAAKTVAQEATKIYIKQLKTNPDVATSYIEQEVIKIAKKKENVSTVAVGAMEILAISPPSSTESAEGPEQLSDEFLNRFERYAEEASTDDLREKWSKVLAEEIRNPGAFSLKVLRIVDEIDTETAKSFNELSRFRIGSDVPKCLYKTSYDNAARMAEYDLIRSDDLGVSRLSQAGTLGDGTPVNYIGIGNYLLAIANAGSEDIIRSAKNRDLVSWSEGQIRFPIYSTTRSGGAIINLLEDNSFSNFMSVVEKLRSLGLTVFPFTKDRDGGGYTIIPEHTVTVVIDEQAGTATVKEGHPAGEGR